MSDILARVAFVAAFLAVIAFRGTFASPSSEATTSPDERRVHASMLRVLEKLPQEDRQAWDAFTERHTRAGTSMAEIQQIGFELAARGLVRLEGDLLVDRARIMALALGRMDEATCAQISAGVESFDSSLSHALIAVFSDRELDEWTYVVLRASAAELRRTPAPPDLDDHTIGRTFDALYDRLSVNEQALVDTVIDAPHLASPRDTCAAGRILIGAPERMSPPWAVHWARLLVTPA